MFSKIVFLCLNDLSDVQGVYVFSLSTINEEYRVEEVVNCQQVYSAMFAAIVLPRKR
jgi:hypothetical protein